MPLYFFNVYNGRSTTDTEGTELLDRQTARCEAIRLAGHILCDDANRLLPEEEWRLEVVDITGSPVLALDLSFTEAPKVRRRMSDA